MKLHRFIFSSILALLISACPVWAATLAASGPAKPLRASDVPLRSRYPVKTNITTTYFWVGQGSSGYNDTTNYQSAWDKEWTHNFGGTDSPEKRVSVRTSTVSLPRTFAPMANPFYVALPFNDVKYPELARRFVPWWNEAQFRRDRFKSQCKGRWVMIEHNGDACFAQWEDVGPLRYDHAAYVFGNERPTTEHSGAGLDVSPAVRDYLGLNGLDKTSWRFVEADEVPEGPWLKFTEQAVLFSALKNVHPQAKP